MQTEEEKEESKPVEQGPIALVCEAFSLARQLIRDWHDLHNRRADDLPGVWGIYERNSPEMQALIEAERKALAAIREQAPVGPTPDLEFDPVDAPANFNGVLASLDNLRKAVNELSNTLAPRSEFGGGR